MTFSTPTAVYRLQFGRGLGFRRAAEVVPYLASLGASHVYASPLLTAQRGGHGYDLVDPTKLNAELGTSEDFEGFWDALREHRMGLVLDLVPNHMAANPDENPWWRDVLAHGRKSRFAGWFDIDWDAPGLGGRVLLPVLRAPLADVLAAGELGLDAPGDGAVFRYFERSFPVASGSASVGDIEAAQRDPMVLTSVLERQHYRLVDWRTGNAQLNYRRFFDVSELAAIRQEEPSVFRATHELMLRLARRGTVDGVPVAFRIDHIDGLADPGAYLERFRAASAGAHTVVEKILAPREDLPATWPVDGESGYAFMDAVDGLFVDGSGLARLDDVVTDALGASLPPFAQIARAGKRRVLEVLFRAELQSLARIARRIADRGTSEGRDISTADLAEAIEGLTVALPIYRTYLRSGEPVHPVDKRLIERAAAEAVRASTSSTVRDAIAFLVDTLRAVSEEPDVGEFAVRWQQLSGATAAKGVEDTALYRDPRVPSRAEVGTDPGAPLVSAEEFHRRMRRRQRHRPGSFSATSTHDTKRSEDARARLHGLSEMPEVWAARVARWRTWNAQHRVTIRGRVAPDPLDELALYEALLGIWPIQGDRNPDFLRRVQQFVVKASQEAKVETTRFDPDDDYEEALRGFVAAILSDPRSRFSRDVDSFARELAFTGVLNALGASVLKVAAPGVPHVYQGTELWNPRLVDPDNRGPVDFEVPRRLLEGLDADVAAVGSLAVLRDLRGHWPDGRLKLYVLSRSLRLRARHRDLFEAGRYLPVEVRGRRCDYVVAFARRRRTAWALTVVARLTKRLVDTAERWPMGEGAWGSTTLILPDGAPTRWRDAFSGATVSARARSSVHRVSLATVLADLPVALLEPWGE